MNANELIEKISLFEDNNHKRPSIIIVDKLFVQYLALMFPSPPIEDLDKPNTTIKFMGIRIIRSEDLNANEFLVY